MAAQRRCVAHFLQASTRPAIASSSITCLAQRPYSGKSKAKQPSRMVLADNVYRSPRPQEERQRSRRTAAGPFAGMNRTVANLDPRRAVNRSRPSERGDSSKRGGRSDDSRRTPDDRKALRMHRALASVSYGRRNLVKDQMAQFESFDQMEMLPDLRSTITEELFKGLTDIKPTPVQRLAIPALLGQGKQPRKPTSGPSAFLLAAETGSGKTLAYLLPAVNALKVAEAADPEIQAFNERMKIEREHQKQNHGRSNRLEEPHPTMVRPKVIVLVPTAELAQQVLKVAKSISHVIKFKTDMLSSDLSPQQIQRNMYGNRGVDVIVSTPHLLASMADSDPNILSRVSHLVIDEADSLFDRSFAPVTSAIIDKASPSLKQLVCCSATIPRKLNRYLADNYPDMVRITTPNLHAIPRRVQLGVIDVSKDPYRNNKDLACADALYTIGKEVAMHELPDKDEVDVRRVIVFVNEREKTEELATYLQSKGIDAVALHRDTPEKRHGEVLSTFTSSDALRIPRPAPGKHRALKNVKVLVVTDLASRGIDTVAVRHVILYDVPHTTIDFIHRLGRAGRMGRRGRGVVLVGNDDRRDIVADVKRSMFMGQALI